MVQIVSLDQMRQTVRRMTGRFVPQQMSDSQLDKYINLYLTLHFPLQFKNIKLTKPFSFTTVPNVDTYDFVYQNDLIIDAAGNEVPGNIQISPPIYCQGYLLRYYQDKTTFYNRWPKLSVNQQINTGTGVPADVYTGTIPPTPFLRAQVDIQGDVTDPAVTISAFDDSGTSFVFTDQPVVGSNTGNLVNNANVLVGTVNYLTGAYSLIASINVNMPIFAAVIPYGASRPTDMLFYNQQMTLRPVPLQVYQVEFQISQQPTQLIASGAAPELDEWYELICLGAAKLIYTDFPDPEGMQYIMEPYQEQLQMAQRRTLRQMSSQRVATIFSQPGRPLASWFWGTEYSGSM